jgi:hypothetical protein
MLQHTSVFRPRIKPCFHKKRCLWSVTILTIKNLANLGTFYHIYEYQLQWKPLNVITDNVITRLMLSHSKIPGLFVQTVQRKFALCDQTA